MIIIITIIIIRRQFVEVSNDDLADRGSNSETVYCDIWSAFCFMIIIFNCYFLNSFQTDNEQKTDGPHKLYMVSFMWFIRGRSCSHEKLGTIHSKKNWVVYICVRCQCDKNEIMLALHLVFTWIHQFFGFFFCFSHKCTHVCTFSSNAFYAS